MGIRNLKLRKGLTPWQKTKYGAVAALGLLGASAVFSHFRSKPAAVKAKTEMRSEVSPIRGHQPSAITKAKEKPNLREECVKRYGNKQIFTSMVTGSAVEQTLAKFAKSCEPVFSKGNPNFEFTIEHLDRAMQALNWATKSERLLAAWKSNKAGAGNRDKNLRTFVAQRIAESTPGQEESIANVVVASSHLSAREKELLLEIGKAVAKP